MEKSVLVVQATIKQYRVPFFLGLHAALQGKGIELVVAYGDPPTSEEKKRDDVELEGPCGKKIRNRWWLGERLLLQSIFREVRRADLIIMEQAGKNLMNYVLLLLSALRMKKVAYWGHGYNRKGDPRSIAEKLKRLLLGRVDWWFAYTPKTTRYLLACGVPEEIITTVFNTMDTKRFREELDAVTASELMVARRSLGLDDGRQIGLYCGSLYREKHIGFLLKASAMIKEALPEFELLVIGGGSGENELMEAAEGRCWIHCLGPRFGHDKAVFFRMAHVFLNPGVVGLAILDGFAAGIPMITTDIPNHGPEIEYLEDGRNGLMTPHDERQYADNVVSLLLDDDRRSKMRESALESGKEYSIANMVDRFKAGIVSCLSARH